MRTSQFRARSSRWCSAVSTCATWPRRSRAHASPPAKCQSPQRDAILSFGAARQTAKRSNPSGGASHSRRRAGERSVAVGRPVAVRIRRRAGLRRSRAGARPATWGSRADRGALRPGDRCAGGPRRRVLAPPRTRILRPRGRSGLPGRSSAGVCHRGGRLPGGAAKRLSLARSAFRVGGRPDPCRGRGAKQLRRHRLP